MRKLVMKCDRCGDDVEVETCNVVTLQVGRVAPANPTQIQSYIPRAQAQWKVKCSMDLCDACLDATGYVEWVSAEDSKKTIGDMFEDMIYAAIETAQEG